MKWASHMTLIAEKIKPEGNKMKYLLGTLYYLHTVVILGHYSIQEVPSPQLV
jgi:hypothetical protein